MFEPTPAPIQWQLDRDNPETVVREIIDAIIDRDDDIQSREPVPPLMRHAQTLPAGMMEEYREARDRWKRMRRYEKVIMDPRALHELFAVVNPFDVTGTLLQNMHRQGDFNVLGHVYKFERVRVPKKLENRVTLL